VIYADYQKWCKKAGKPCLAIPQGISQIGNSYYADDGYLYQGKRRPKRVGRYMIIMRFSGEDVLVRFDQRTNIHRFEALRWSVLERVMLLHERLLQILQGLKDLLGDPRETGEVVRAIGEVGGVWRYIDLLNHYSGGSVSTGCVDVDELGVLDKLVVLVRSSEEQDLVGRYFAVSTLLDKYWAKVYMLNRCMACLLDDVHPDVRQPWGKPMVEVVINGRVYCVNSVHTTIKEATDYWPTPMRERISLDAADRPVRLEPAAV